MRPAVDVLRVLACLSLIGSAGACTAAHRAAHRPEDEKPSVRPSSTPAASAAKVGNCYLLVTSVSYPSSDLPVDCARAHRTETFAVGTFSAEHAARVTVPPAGSPALRWAFARCDTEAKRFVGGDWRGGRLSIRVVTPSPQAWQDGSRWYRCDISELNALDAGNFQAPSPTETSGSLRAALTRRLPLVYTCFNRDKSDNLQPVSCTTRHRFEFAGIWTAPELVYDNLDASRNQFVRSCWSVIGAFVGAPKVDMSHYVGVTFRVPSADAWQRGDRGVRCFLWSTKRVLTRSVKGAGLRALT